MKVIVHQCIGIQMKRESGFTVREARKECPQILFIPKDTLPAVPTADHMVESARKMNARSTSHTGTIPKNNPCVNSELQKPDPKPYEDWVVRQPDTALPPQIASRQPASKTPYQER